MLATYREFDLIDDPDERARVAHLADRMPEIEGAESRMDMIYMVADQEGISRKTMVRLFYSWRKDGIWGLVDQRKVRSVTRDNVGYRIFLAYCDRAIGGFDTNAHRALLTDLRSGKVFPEFGTWRDLYKAEHPYERVPDTCPPEWIPHGWGYANFEERQKKDAGRQLQRVYARRGQHAALRYTPQVIRSRYDEETGEQVHGLTYVEADDQWGNVMVRLPTGHVVRPVSFSFVDVATGFVFNPYMKPRLVEIENGRLKSSNLNEFEFRSAMAHFLCTVGFNKVRGITFGIEKGTTAIRENVRKRVAEIPAYGRLIRFTTSGALNVPAHKGLFVGSAGGNPRFKAHVEESHKDIQARLSLMPGNIGRSAETKHESTAALERYAKGLVADASKYSLPPELDRFMSYGVPTFDEYCAAFNCVVDQINDDADHRLEGWVKYVRSEFRSNERSGEWWPIDEMARLDEVDRAMVQRRISANPEALTRVRKMTRREALETYREEVDRLPIHEAWRFMDPRDAKVLTVKPGNTVEFTDSVYYPNRRMVYDAVYVDRAGRQQILPVGKKVRVYWNPWGEMQKCVWYAEEVKDEDGNVKEKYLGLAQRVKTGVVGDRQKTLEAVGAAVHKKVMLMDGMADRHFVDAVEKKAAEFVNRAILATAKERQATGPAVDGEGYGLDQLNDAAIREEEDVAGASRPDEGSNADALAFLDSVNAV